MRHLLLPLLFGLLVGCGARQDRSYADTARYRYEQGLEAFEDENYLEAVQEFAAVKNRFPYSQYAALAELRTADAYFAQEKYIEAIDAYRTFIQGRPNHKDVPYASWRIGVANMEQMPSNFFLFPPAHEKDQAATKEALRTLEQYVQRYPTDEHQADAKKRVAECRTILADHELYVARFYLRDGRVQSAKGRLEGLVADYADLPSRWRTAALLLVDVYSQLKQDADAKKTAELLVAQHPQSDEAEEARRLIRP